MHRFRACLGPRLQAAMNDATSAVFGTSATEDPQRPNLETSLS